MRPPLSAPALRAAELDRADPLARFRAEFHLPPGQIYMDGNSLGLLSHRAEASLLRALNEWRTLGINGWSDATPPWLTLTDDLAAKLASLVGAAPDEIAVTGSTTVNLHQLLATLFDPAAARKVIVADSLNFASDAHALSSHLRQRGLDPATHLREIRSRDGRTLHDDDIIAALTPDVQLAMLPAVLYMSGQLLDVARITREAHARGIVIGWDCSHSIGAVLHDFDRDGVDFAFWSSYKFLNAGPGATSALYLNRRHFGRTTGLAGWWGVRKDRRFALSHTHEAAAGAEALQIGTPHVLSLAPLQGALEIFAEAGGVAPLRAKSLALTSYLMELIDAELTVFGCSVANPREPQRRGGHVALAHPDAWRLAQALKAAGVVPDFRQPDIIRLAPTALYNTFADCAETVARLKNIFLTRAHEKFPAQRALVT